MKSKAFVSYYVLLLSLIVNACNIQVGDTTAEAPSKPDSVPAEAIWSGGPDGGVFLSITRKEGDATGVYQGQIYHDQTGELEYSGDLKINDNSRAIVNLMDPATYAGWDGTRLYLADGRYLSALEIPQEPAK